MDAEVLTDLTLKPRMRAFGTCASVSVRSFCAVLLATPSVKDTKFHITFFILTSQKYPNRMYMAQGQHNEQKIVGVSVSALAQERNP